MTERPKPHSLGKKYPHVLRRAVAGLGVMLTAHEIQSGEYLSASTIGVTTAAVMVDESRRTIRRYVFESTDLLDGVEGITYVENTAAGMIKDTVGLAFDDVPRKIIFDDQNRSAIRKKSRLRSYAMKKTTELPDTFAFSESHNAYVVNQDPEPVKDVWFNLLMYMKKKNPNYIMTHQDLLQQVTSLGNEDGLSAETLFVRDVFKKYFLDGFSQHVITRSIGQQVDSIFEDIPLGQLGNDGLFGKDQIRHESHTNWVPPKADHLEAFRRDINTIATLPESEIIQGFANIIGIPQEFGHSKHEYFIASHYLYTMLTSIAKRRDISYVQALNILIENPPSTFEEITNPNFHYKKLFPEDQPE